MSSMTVIVNVCCDEAMVFVFQANLTVAQVCIGSTANEFECVHSNILYMHSVGLCRLCIWLSRF